MFGPSTRGKKDPPRLKWSSTSCKVSNLHVYDLQLEIFVDCRHHRHLHLLEDVKVQLDHHLYHRHQTRHRQVVVEVLVEKQISDQSVPCATTQP